jgi:hypothetical protein
VYERFSKDLLFEKVIAKLPVIDSVNNNFVLMVVIVTGNPQVFRGNPYLYPVKPVPLPKGRGFDRSG